MKVTWPRTYISCWRVSSNYSRLALCFQKQILPGKSDGPSVPHLNSNTTSSLKITSGTICARLAGACFQSRPPQSHVCKYPLPLPMSSRWHLSPIHPSISTNDIWQMLCSKTSLLPTDVWLCVSKLRLTCAICPRKLPSLHYMLLPLLNIQILSLTD
jgi:hypothetical protein